jgi:hypothetical protein
MWGHKILVYLLDYDLMVLKSVYESRVLKLRVHSSVNELRVLKLLVYSLVNVLRVLKLVQVTLGCLW